MPAVSPTILAAVRGPQPQIASSDGASCSTSVVISSFELVLGVVVVGGRAYALQGAVVAVLDDHGGGDGVGSGLGRGRRPGTRVIAAGLVPGLAHHADPALGDSGLEVLCARWCLDAIW